VDPRRAEYQDFLLRELQALREDKDVQLPSHNRWGNPLTDVHFGFFEGTLIP